MKKIICIILAMVTLLLVSCEQNNENSLEASEDNISEVSNEASEETSSTMSKAEIRNEGLKRMDALTEEFSELYFKSYDMQKNSSIKSDEEEYYYNYKNSTKMIDYDANFQYRKGGTYNTNVKWGNIDAEYVSEYSSGLLKTTVTYNRVEYLEGQKTEWSGLNEVIEEKISQPWTHRKVFDEVHDFVSTIKRKSGILKEYSEKNGLITLTYELTEDYIKELVRSMSNAAELYSLDVTFKYDALDVKKAAFTYVLGEDYILSATLDLDVTMEYYDSLADKETETYEIKWFETIDNIIYIDENTTTLD